MLHPALPSCAIDFVMYRETPFRRPSPECATAAGAAPTLQNRQRYKQLRRAPEFRGYSSDRRRRAHDFQRRVEKHKRPTAVMQNYYSWMISPTRHTAIVCYNATNEVSTPTEID